MSRQSVKQTLSISRQDYDNTHIFQKKLAVLNDGSDFKTELIMLLVICRLYSEATGLVSFFYLFELIVP